MERTKPITSIPIMQKYSQYNEQEYILNHFGTSVGSFLDIGAYDGKTFSNTFALAEMGWSGLMIDPSPFAFRSLMVNLQDHPKVQLLNACITPYTDDLVEMHDSLGDALTSSNPEHLNKWKEVRFQKFIACGVSIPKLFNNFGYGWSFINIDVEGGNLDLVKAIQWNALTDCKMVCIEYDNDLNTIQNIMTGHGFSLVHLNGTNVIMGR